MGLLASNFFNDFFAAARPKLIVVALLVLLLIAFFGLATSRRTAHSQSMVLSHSGKSSQIPSKSPQTPAGGTQFVPASPGESNSSQSSASGQAANGSTVVEVNGRKIVVPPNTSFSQTFHDPGSQTSVSVDSSQHSSQSSSGSSSSVSSSSSSVEVNTQQP